MAAILLGSSNTFFLESTRQSSHLRVYFPSGRDPSSGIPQRTIWLCRFHSHNIPSCTPKASSRLITPVRAWTGLRLAPITTPATCPSQTSREVRPAGARRHLVAISSATRHQPLHALSGAPPAPATHRHTALIPNPSQGPQSLAHHSFPPQS